MAEADSEGIISVVSAGNEGWDLDPPSTRRLFPQCYEFPSIICVAASDDDDVRWTTGVQSSNVGASSVDLAAPGAEILSTCIESEGHYCVKSGTSMAAPHVAGALALVMASNPWLTPLEARQQLLTNVDPVAAWQGLTVTGGRLNLYKALAAYERVVSPNGGERLFAGTAVTIEWTQDRTTAVDLVDIWLLRDGEDDLLIAEGEPNDGQYEWNVGASAVAQSASLKIVSHNVHSPVLGLDLSDAPFTILEAFPVNYVDRTTESQLDYEGTPYSSVAFDYSDDGKPDLFISIKDAPGQLYKRGNVLNNNAQFENETRQAFRFGDAPPAGLRGLSVASCDDDRALEIFAAHNTTPRLYDWVEGQFQDKAAATGVLANAQNSWAGAWADYDGDGQVDLYVCRAAYAGQDPTPGDIDALPDVLLRNQMRESGVFVPFSLPGPSSAAITAAWEDVDGQNGPDLFVGDLRAAGGPTTYPKLYINQGDGTLVDEFAARFSTDPQAIHSCTSVEWADLDRDGKPDLVLGTMTDQAWVFLNSRTADFRGAPVLVPAGGAVTGVKVYDADLDGWLDLLCLPRGSGLPARLWVNAQGRGGCRLIDVTLASGLTGFAGRVDGATTVSYDHDRIPDLYLGKALAAGSVYLKGGKRLEPPLPGGDVAVHLHGYANDGGSIGAKAVFTVGAAEVVRSVDGGSGRGAQRDLIVSCGIGDETGPIPVEITWPSDFVRTVSVPRDSVLVVCDEGSEPQIPLGSVTASHQPKPGGLTDWIFTWETSYRSDADQDLVTITDAPGSPGQCLLGQTVELRPGDPGVVGTLTAKAGGGYEHKVIWQDRLCVPNCTYDYKVASATACAASAPMSGWKQLRVRVCAQ